MAGARSEILGHLSEHYHKPTYEKQAGAHAYWLKPNKGGSIDDVHKTLTSKGVKVRKIAGASYSNAELVGHPMGHHFSISKEGEPEDGPKQLHVRFHRTEADRMGLDEDSQHSEEQFVPGHVSHERARQIVKELHGCPIIEAL